MKAKTQATILYSLKFVVYSILIFLVFVQYGIDDFPIWLYLLFQFVAPIVLALPHNIDDMFEAEK